MEIVGYIDNISDFEKKYNNLKYDRDRFDAFVDIMQTYCSSGTNIELGLVKRTYDGITSNYFVLCKPQILKLSNILTNQVSYNIKHCFKIGDTLYKIKNIDTHKYTYENLTNGVIFNDVPLNLNDNALFTFNVDGHECEQQILLTKMTVEVDIVCNNNSNNVLTLVSHPHCSAILYDFCYPLIKIEVIREKIIAYLDLLNENDLLTPTEELQFENELYELLNISNPLLNQAEENKEAYLNLPVIPKDLCVKDEIEECFIVHPLHAEVYNNLYESFILTQDLCNKFYELSIRIDKKLCTVMNLI